jgi:hypothetical protein
MKYYVARRNGGGWSLEEFKSLDEIRDTIKLGGTYGQEFKILKEIELTLIDNTGRE